MKFQPAKGTRDLLPEDAIKMQKIMQTCRDVFEKYGFEPLITPAFESFDLLAAKGGYGEAVKDEIYYFKDKSDRELGLRFDLTIPLARVASSNSFSKPFKRYAVDKVWRYDQPQAKRWREFFQADIDVVGSKSLLSDVECLAAICEVLDKLGFKDYQIRINNRKVLEEFVKKIVDPDKVIEAFRTIDKLDKVGLEGVEAELKSKNIPESLISKLLAVREIEKIEDSEGRKELDGFFELVKEFGIYEKLRFDITLVRGLEYYTSMVYEVNLGANVSCGGGGRYDNLIKIIGSVDLPATGISLGLDRILEVMKENKMFDDVKSTKVFVISAEGAARNDIIKIARELRENDINVQMDVMDRNFSKQLEYASNSKIPYVMIVGKEELNKKEFKLKDMKTGEQKELKLKDVISSLKIKGD
ncbi:MAG: histidine--tRNA ligase [Candidatus Aenigmarchaeota archaeon]|nr:histidine--tRNA ligase [Candidatus Aenigmarchaeota archaeon]